MFWLIIFLAIGLFVFLAEQEQQQRQLAARLNRFDRQESEQNRVYVPMQRAWPDAQAEYRMQPWLRLQLEELMVKQHGDHLQVQHLTDTALLYLSLGMTGPEQPSPDQTTAA